MLDRGITKGTDAELFGAEEEEEGEEEEAPERLEMMSRSDEMERRAPPLRAAPESIELAPLMARL